MPGVSSATVSVVEHTLAATFDGAVAGTTAIIKALDDVGYAVSGEPRPAAAPGTPTGLRVNPP